MFRLVREKIPSTKPPCTSPLRICFLALAALLACPALRAADAKPIRVALYDDEGAYGKGVPRVSEILGKPGDIQVTIFKATDLPGALEEMDVVIFTGGSGCKQGNAIGERHRRRGGRRRDARRRRWA